MYGIEWKLSFLSESILSSNVIFYLDQKVYIFGRTESTVYFNIDRLYKITSKVDNIGVKILLA